MLNKKRVLASEDILRYGRSEDPFDHMPALFPRAFCEAERKAEHLCQLPQLYPQSYLPSAR